MSSTVQFETAQVADPYLLHTNINGITTGRINSYRGKMEVVVGPSDFVSDSPEFINLVNEENQITGSIRDVVDDWAAYCQSGRVYYIPEFRDFLAQRFLSKLLERHLLRDLQRTTSQNIPVFTPNTRETMRLDQIQLQQPKYVQPSLPGTVAVSLLFENQGVRSSILSVLVPQEQHLIAVMSTWVDDSNNYGEKRAIRKVYISPSSVGEKDFTRADGEYVNISEFQGVRAVTRSFLFDVTGKTVRYGVYGTVNKPLDDELKDMKGKWRYPRNNWEEEFSQDFNSYLNFPQQESDLLMQTALEAKGGVAQEIDSCVLGISAHTTRVKNYSTGKLREQAPRAAEQPVQQQESFIKRVFKNLLK